MKMAGMTMTFALIGVTLLISAAVKAAEADRDERGEKVSRYNDAVVSWRDEGALEAWRARLGDAAVVRLELVRGAGVGNASVGLEPMDTGSEEHLPWKGFIAPRQQLKDVGKDLEMYEEGLVWWAEVERAHKKGVKTQEAWVVRDEGGEGLEVDAFTCKTTRGKAQRCTTVDGLQECSEVQVVEAKKDWLIGLELVAAEGQAGGVKLVTAEKCASQWETKYVKKDVPEDSTSRAVELELCQDGRPPENLDMDVTLRSPSDPHLTAGLETGCTYHFGKSPERIRSTAVGLAWAGFAFLLPLTGILLCVCGSTLSERACSKRAPDPVAGAESA